MVLPPPLMTVPPMPCSTCILTGINVGSVWAGGGAVPQQAISQELANIDILLPVLAY
jgi:hypothetical protein